MGEELDQEIKKDAERLRLVFNEKLLENIQISKIDTSIKDQLIIFKLGTETLRATNADVASFLQLLRQTGIVSETWQSNILVTTNEFNIETLDNEILQDIISGRLGLHASRLNKVV